MSGPYGPNDTPGPGEGRNDDPTQQWGGQQPPGSAGPTQHWGQQPPQQQWGQPQQHGWTPAPTPQWGQSQPSWPQHPPQQAWEPTQQSQWGQQPPQQQWGQPQQQWGQPQQPWDQQQLTPAGPRKSKKGLFIALGAAVVVIVVAVVLAVVLLGSDKLDNKAVQDGVQKVLKDSYGIDDVQDVSCPSGQKVEVGKTFDCSLKVGGEAKKVTVKITKDDGTYEVGRPN
ncbi:DUF4333 domain-containing protein [Nocardia sp. CDC159]|uniref:DUF4333 domain-containing protein n=1 Tax=Nocardia pulmonis TaxID=2951408 RepID=A0A9X2IZZ2_9NOCA|nr:MULTISPECIES: DUF4333 domain-containing protein [Nocardia]MCM6775466.1 DUF4333 domain-containing protein [Nocardia pulmonis]MCM6787800.1 DUF4333 domain-containing protein [Nocardia sp. CDC159]